MKKIKPTANKVAFLRDINSIEDVKALKERRRLYLELMHLELKSSTIRLESTLSADNISEIIAQQTVRSIEKFGLMTFRKFLKKWI